MSPSWLRRGGDYDYDYDCDTAPHAFLKRAKIQRGLGCPQPQRLPTRYASLTSRDWLPILAEPRRMTDYILFRNALEINVHNVYYRVQKGAK